MDELAIPLYTGAKISLFGTLPEVHRKKEYGNKLFCEAKKEPLKEEKKQLYQEALETYVECLSLLRTLYDRGGAREWELTKVLPLEISLISNLSACYFYQGNYRGCKHFCDECLEKIAFFHDNDENNDHKEFLGIKVKVLYRKACSLSRLDDFVDARKLLISAIRLAPKDKILREELARVDQNILRSRNVHKKILTQLNYDSSQNEKEKDSKNNIHYYPEEKEHDSEFCFANRYKMIDEELIRFEEKVKDMEKTNLFKTIPRTSELKKTIDDWKKMEFPSSFHGLEIKKEMVELRNKVQWVKDELSKLNVNKMLDSSRDNIMELIELNRKSIPQNHPQLNNMEELMKKQVMKLERILENFNYANCLEELNEMILKKY